ncbi:hypothetical protein M2480_000327 [Parabacteroides sp. PFB2-12]|uniref:diguanylate cyclase n=1 Tax=unclassified Parabacteroides TaxID=2649774 RepID=UPI00247711AF|nr:MULTISPECIES: diguanylate cyclase [unclassified Parabacteroides]MDH6341177.1 hypothetical protein [Parabacteroides sp. PM6-13]MDH6389367.1 hypothetical protein [Parabacteroides sp. PFB2-12]
MINKEELRARIEWTKRNLQFYALFWHDLLKEQSPEELEKQINQHLDMLIELLKTED